MRGIKDKKKKICSSPWKWDCSPFIHYHEMALVPGENMRMTLCESGACLYLVWVSWSTNTLWSGPLHTPWWKFCPHESTQLREQVGAKIPTSSLHFAKLCTQGGGGGVGCGYTLRKKNLFLIFSGVILSLEFFLLVLWMSRVTSIEQSVLFSRFCITCWSNSRPAHCRTLSLMLAQRDLWRVWCSPHGKGNTTGVEERGWILVLPCPPCMTVGGHLLASVSSPVR